MKRQHAMGRALMLLFILFGFSFYASSQISVKGTVTDGKDPVPGVTILEVGTTNGTITDFDGNYTIKVAGKDSKLSFSFIGLTTQTLEVGNNSVLNVTMKDELSELDEVVVVGYGTVKKKDLTGASASLGSDQIKNIPVTTAAQAITGKIAGVSVVSNSGAPGASVNITVRGGSSITNSTDPIYIVDGFEMEDALSSIDINDIASIDVMKDASSTAIYGARGSNGVVIITTKSAQAGKTKIDYNMYYSFDKLGKKLDVLGVRDYADYEYELQALQGNEDDWTSWFGGDNLNSSDIYNYIDSQYGNQKGIDWQDEVFGNNAVTANHNLSLTGGNEKTNFYVSYNYTNQDGIMTKHGYSKNGLRAKLNHEFTKNIHLNLNGSYSNKDIEGGGELTGLKNTILQPPTGGTKYTNEELLGTDLGDELTEDDYDLNNPLTLNNAVTQESVSNGVSLNGSLTIDFLKDFQFKTAGHYTWSQNHATYFDDGSTLTAKNLDGPYGYIQDKTSHGYQWTNTLSWHKELGQHSFNVLVGQEVIYKTSYKTKNYYYQFTDENFGLNDISMASVVSSGDYTSSTSESGTVSGFGRLMYNFKDKYLFSGSMRGDGCSQFAPGKHWGYFPSASVAWRVSQESFMANLTFIDDLKLRFGIGESGNSDIGNNMYTTDYESSTYGIDGSSVTTLHPGSTMGNPNVKWETIVSKNLGFDLTLLSSRINLTGDFYVNKSADLLLHCSIPTSTGYSYQYQNIGALQNKGMEFVLNTVNIKNAGGFSWTSNFNISLNRSKVLELYNGADMTFTSSSAKFLLQEGKPLGQFYGYKYDGVYTTDDFESYSEDGGVLKEGVAYLKGGSTEDIKPGDYKYKGINGDTDDDGNPVFSTDDRGVVGHMEPKFSGGFRNTFTYKGFDLGVFLHFVYGNEIFNESSMRFYGPYKTNQNALAKMNDRYRLVDPSTGEESYDLTRLAELNPDQSSKDQLWSVASTNKTTISQASSYFLEDGSYLRIKEITLGYSLPKTLLSRYHISKLRVYGTLNNMFTFTKYTGYDPEVSASSSLLYRGVDNSSYPRSKGCTFGLNLSF